MLGDLFLRLPRAYWSPICRCGSFGRGILRNVFFGRETVVSGPRLIAGGTRLLQGSKPLHLPRAVKLPPRAQVYGPIWVSALQHRAPSPPHAKCPRGVMSISRQRNLERFPCPAGEFPGREILPNFFLPCPCRGCRQPWRVGWMYMCTVSSRQFSGASMAIIPPACGISLVSPLVHNYRPCSPWQKHLCWRVARLVELLSKSTQRRQQLSRGARVWRLTHSKRSGRTFTMRDACDCIASSIYWAWSVQGWGKERRQARA